MNDTVRTKDVDNSETAGSCTLKRLASGSHDWINRVAEGDAVSSSQYSLSRKVTLHLATSLWGEYVPV